MPRSPLSKPLIITQDFGVAQHKYGSKGHPGLDLRSPQDDKWFSCVPGFLHLKGVWPYLTGYGAYWELDWGQADGSVIKFIYGHSKDRRKEWNKKHAPEGTFIARSGNTGWSTAAHLHFEVRLYKPKATSYSLIDPKTLLKQWKIPYKYA